MSLASKPPKPPRMSVEDFLVWAEAQEGRWELIDGEPVPKNGDGVDAMAPERIRHADAKGEAFASLRQAIRDAALPCRAYVDGSGLRGANDEAFIPDVVVTCTPQDGDAQFATDPVIVVEVLSPSTSQRDVSTKLAAYFALPSVHHYLILDPKRRTLVHHRRATDEAGGPIATSILRDGTLVLDPPGLAVALADLLPPPDPEG